ncbi:MAG TPA: alpha/beta fold hydrolase [Burkholderiales bacterium]|nr:alpha/beta fold hydrolase [Burkholderiales bacterium]
MSVEWACLSDQRPIAAASNDLTLPDGDRGYVLLFHGLTGSPSEFAYVAHYLRHRAGLSVWCPQLVNHGQPIGVLARTRWQELEKFAHGCYEKARAEARARGVPLFVGGLSLGAILALLLAAEPAGDIQGAICLAPTLFYDGWNVPWTHKLIPFAAYTPLKYFAYFREEAPYGLKDEVLRERIAQHYAKATLRDDVGAAGYAHFPVRSFCEIRNLFARCIARLHRVVCPVLLVQAAEDDITGPENSAFIHRKIGSTHKKILLLSNSYHIVTADLEREKVAQEIVRFCASIAEPQPSPGS